MKRSATLLFLLFGFIPRQPATAQIYDTNTVAVQTFVGSGFYGYVDGVGTATMFNQPIALAPDASGNLFVLDRGNFRIRKITPQAVVSTFAGGGTNQLPGYGTNVSLELNSSFIIPGWLIYTGMSMDSSNALCVPLSYSIGSAPLALLRVAANGWASAVLRNKDGAQIIYGGVCIDSKGWVYVTDRDHQKVYRYQMGGPIEVFAGSGNTGALDGNGLFTSFDSPTVLAVDKADNIYVWDSGNYLVRKINQRGDVVTMAGHTSRPLSDSDKDGVGTNAFFMQVFGMACDEAGNLLLACGTSVRKMTPERDVTTIAGSFTEGGYADGAGPTARFREASGICLAGGAIYVSDRSDHRIRSIMTNPTIQPVSEAGLSIDLFAGISLNGAVGRAYRIESSRDGRTWTAEETFLLTSSPYFWLDKSTVSGQKLYRAFILP